MNKDNYSIHEVVYQNNSGYRYAQYRGRVMTDTGYWKVSEDFNTYTEAELWCQSKRQ